MGRSGSKARKPKQHLPKVPKYEEPNSLTGNTRGGYGSRYGHGSDHGEKRIGRAGAFVLRTLGLRPKS